MDRSFLSGLSLLAGIALLAAAFAVQAILLEGTVATMLLAGMGTLLVGWGVFALRTDLAAMIRRRRGEIVLHAVGVIGVLVALVYLSARYPFRVDLTEAGLYSLSEQTMTMLKRLEKPVHIVFFHDPIMRETVELYELIARQTPLVTLELYDPMLNPAQARRRGVQFAGTAIMQSEDRRVQVHGSSETDIANGILRVSQGAKQLVCFLDGHGEADPFSKEDHDHLEGAAGHSHGLGAQYVLHERHGMAKARHALENLNYKVEKLSLMQGPDVLSLCALLVVAGPKMGLLPAEIAAVREYLAAGGDAFFMLDPFVQSGLEPVIREHGVVLDDTIVIDPASHFWADVSSPAVTSYNRHQLTRDLPLTFFPGARSLSPTLQRVPGAAVTPLVNSSRKSFGETTPERAEFDEGRDRPGPLTLMVVINRRPVTADDPAAIRFGPQAEGTTSATSSDAVPTGVAGRSRIAVVGDSDFVTNSFFHLFGNANLFLNTVNYLAAQENLIGIRPRTYDLPRVHLTNRQMKGTFFASVVLIPAVLAVVGTAVWWKQR